MIITDKIRVECLEQSKIQEPKTKLESEYNQYLTDCIFEIQMKRWDLFFKNKKWNL